MNTANQLLNWIKTNEKETFAILNPDQTRTNFIRYNAENEFGISIKISHVKSKKFKIEFKSQDIVFEEIFTVSKNKKSYEFKRKIADKFSISIFKATKPWNQVTEQDLIEDNYYLQICGIAKMWKNFLMPHGIFSVLNK